MTHSKGFSLIELMIVVAIVGILSTIAFGFYGDNVIAANRTEGRSALQTAAGTLEKCRSLYGSYNNANCNYADFTSETDLYDITGAIAASSFTLGSPNSVVNVCWNFSSVSAANRADNVWST